ncbi:MAG: ParB/RepB/Spo0J family partition protein [Planctomycetaceae bacterium]|nr:ParB/RepB/Spo0J family partition protein [Planctomycetaceae bacterium]
MTSTRQALQEVNLHIEESMGVRTVDSRPRFSPVPDAKDVGRLPSRKHGLVEIDRVIPDPQQPRTEFDEHELKRLANSIREKGLLQPIRVRWDAEREKWIVIMGERRYRATKLAGLSQISCCFVDDELTSSELLEQQLIENLLREDLKPLEEAKAYSTLMEMNGWNGKQVAGALHVSPSKVSRALSLLDLPTEVRSKIEQGSLTPTSAYELTKLNNEEIQKELSTTNNLTQKQVVQIVRQRRRHSRSSLRGTSLKFPTSSGMSISVQGSKKFTYHEIREALEEVLEEVELRIQNNVRNL